MDPTAQMEPTDELDPAVQTGQQPPERPVNPATLPDVYVRCPYFPEHELRRSRLPYHLLKCQKNPYAPKLLACPYNYMHRVRYEDRAEHLASCEDKPKTKYSEKDMPSYGNTLKEVGEKRRRSNHPMIAEEPLDDQRGEW